MKILAILLMLPAIIFFLLAIFSLIIDMALSFYNYILTRKNKVELIPIILIIMFMVGYSLMFGLIILERGK